MSGFFFSCFTQFCGSSHSLNIFDKFRNAALLKRLIYCIRTKKDNFFLIPLFFFSRYLKKFHLFLSMNKKLQENGTILITTAIPRQCGYPFRLSNLLCREYMFGHASSVSVKSRCFSWSLSPRWININDPYSVAHKGVRKRACLHGGGESQVVEVTRLDGAKKITRVYMQCYNPAISKKRRVLAVNTLLISLENETVGLPHLRMTSIVSYERIGENTSSFVRFNKTSHQEFHCVVLHPYRLAIVTVSFYIILQFFLFLKCFPWLFTHL